MAELSAINQITALGESMTGLADSLQINLTQLMDLVNQTAASMQTSFAASFTTMLESTTPFLNQLSLLSSAGQSLNLSGPLDEINLSIVSLNESLTTSQGIFGGLFDSIALGASFIGDLTTGIVNLTSESWLHEKATKAITAAKELLNIETLKEIGNWIREKAEIVASTAAKVAEKIATGVVTAAQAALNLVMSMNPIVLVVIAITALIAVFVLLWNNCEGFRNFFSGLWDGIVNVVRSAIDVVVGIFQGIVSFISDYVVKPIAGFFTGLWNGVGDGVKGMVNFVIGVLNGMIKGFLAPFNLIIDGLNLIPGVSIKKLSFEIPKLASGGVVSTPTYALIGEGQYPEAVMPLGNSPQMKDFVRQIAAAVGSKTGEHVFNIYLDGKQITASVEKHQRERGANIMSGGVLIGV